VGQIIVFCGLPTLGQDGILRVTQGVPRPTAAAWRVLAAIR